MKRERKIFLIVWIPMMIIVCLALYGNIGKERTIKGSVEKEKIPITDLTMPYAVVIVFSILAYFIAGLESTDPKEQKKENTKR